MTGSCEPFGVHCNRSLIISACEEIELSGAELHDVGTDLSRAGWLGTRQAAREKPQRRGRGSGSERRPVQPAEAWSAVPAIGGGRPRQRNEPTLATSAANAASARASGPMPLLPMRVDAAVRVSQAAIRRLASVMVESGLLRSRKHRPIDIDLRTEAAN